MYKRQGYDQVLGYLYGGFEAWKKAGKQTDEITSVTAQELAETYEDHPEMPIRDVRRAAEFEAEHVEGAENTPLDYLSEHMAAFPKEQPFYVHCAGGYRSMIAASILKARGYHEVVNVKGGFKAIAETELPRTTFVCPSQKS